MNFSCYASSLSNMFLNPYRGDANVIIDLANLACRLPADNYLSIKDFSRGLFRMLIARALIAF